MSQYGTDSIKDGLALLFSLGEGCEKALADGKFNLADLPHFVDAVTKLPAAITNASKIPKELWDLDDAEVDDLYQWAQTEFDIADDVLEVRIEKGIRLAAQLIQYISEW